MKKVIGVILAVIILTGSVSFAESAVDVIMNTGTTQVFTDESVPIEDLETIIRAGLAAESAINQQPWFFAVVSNPEIMEEITGSGMGFAPPAGGSKPEGAPEGKPGGEAPAASPAGSGGKSIAG